MVKQLQRNGAGGGVETPKAASCDRVSSAILNVNSE